MILGMKDVSVIMGSKSDYPTMVEAVNVLTEFGVTVDAHIVSAHRTPKKLYDFASSAQDKGYKVIIAGAGGAAHLPGMVAALTCLPVLGVPIASKSLAGLDSLLSIVQMPYGIPVGTLAIATPGAKNAALLAVRILALSDTKLAKKLDAFVKRQTQSVLKDKLP
jgi:5-(carboxyamino)imidazole ribonucleotide mutase